MVPMVRLELMEGPRDARPEQSPTPDTYKETVGPIVSLLHQLRTSAPDAYTIFGGDDEVWHLEELPISGADEQHRRLVRAREIVEAYAEVAGLNADDPIRTQRLNGLRAEYNQALYGIPLPADSQPRAD